MSKIICAVYRSPKKPDAYLYIDKSKGLGCLPEPLLEIFGRPQEAFTFLLTEDRKLAHADARRVMAELSEKGFYLQLPPPLPDEMQAINQHNSKLPR
jgi:uncharacterized protein